MKEDILVESVEVRQEEKGATMLEYILVAVFIGIACMAGLQMLGSSMNDKFNTLSTAVTSGVAP